MSENDSMKAMDVAMKAVFEAMPKSAPETMGTDERTVCEGCGVSRDNGDMNRIGHHDFCSTCDLDGDKLKDLTEALEEEEKVMVEAIKQATAILERARRYRASLRREES